MLNSIQFDISGLLILTVIISLFYIKGTAPSYPNRTFALFIVTLFTAEFFHIIEQILILYAALPPITALVLSEANVFIGSLIPIPFALYAMAITGTMDSISNNKIRFTLLPPLCINTVVLFLSVFIPLAAAGKEESARGLPFIGIVNIVSLYYVALGIIIIVKNKMTLPVKTIQVILIFVGFSLSASLVQLFFPELSIQGFVFSLCALIISLTVQKSEDTSDAITGLYNQTAFEAMNYKRFKTGERFYIIGIVFDDLPFLISTLGVRSINEVLRQTSSFLKTSHKNIQTYHFNDGKFGIVFPNYDLEDVYTCIEVIKKRFLQSWLVNTIEVKIFPRISIIACPEDADSTESVIEFFELLSRDDTYKQEDVILASSMDTAIHKRYAYLDRTIKNSLTEGRIDVYYQPIYCKKKNRIIGAEALIRMKDENGNFVSPEEFIPVAEKNGTILRLGEYVFEKVCRLLSDIRPEEYGIQKIDVNLSVVQCMQEMLAEQIITIANLYKIPFSLLNLEITETAAAYSQETLIKNMQKLSSAGIELSLDDYGSGYSNIGYMINLPFNMIKIDKYIVWNAFKDEKSHTALAYTISMINALRMTVLAEGIETHEQAESLTSLGCQFLQGYYFSKPLPKETFLQLLHHQKNEIEAEGITFNQDGFFDIPDTHSSEENLSRTHSSMTATDDGEEIEELPILDDL